MIGYGRVVSLRVSDCDPAGGDASAYDRRARRVRLLALFNDVILRTAIDPRLDALELRRICTEPADYANPIEPSGPGGRKIADGVARMLRAPMRTPETPAHVWGAANLA